MIFVQSPRWNWHSRSTQYKNHYLIPTATIPSSQMHKSALLIIWLWPGFDTKRILPPVRCTLSSCKPIRFCRNASLTACTSESSVPWLFLCGHQRWFNWILMETIELIQTDTDIEGDNDDVNVNRYLSVQSTVILLYTSFPCAFPAHFFENWIWKRFVKIRTCIRKQSQIIRNHGKANN